MVVRSRYMNKLKKIKGYWWYKIITGVRKSGKTHLIKSFMEELKRNKGPEKKNIIYISFETDNIEKFVIYWIG